ncbi:MAG: hypothetical protein NTV82_00960 [Candidatus Aminicenantes bacterium]|nr:hypothetical protein [Candidatus Aminicenantes bacterium]
MAEPPLPLEPLALPELELPDVLTEFPDEPPEPPDPEEPDEDPPSEDPPLENPPPLKALRSFSYNMPPEETRSCGQ